MSSFETDDGIHLEAFDLKDVIGRNIVCEDGVTRRVEEISRSMAFADMVLINEVNEDEDPGGSWVHILSLCCQMSGNPLPTKEQRQAFSRVASGFRWEDGFIPEEKKLPSGLILLE